MMEDCAKTGMVLGLAIIAALLMQGCTDDPPEKGGSDDNVHEITVNEITIKEIQITEHFLTEETIN